MEVIKRPSLRSRAESFLHISAPSTKGLIYCPSTPLLKGRIGSLKTTPGHIKAKLSLPNLLTSGISWGPSVAPSSPCKNYLREASQADEAPRITPRTNIKRIRDGIPYPVSHNSIMNEVDETTLKLLLHAAQAVSFHDYKGTPPKRVLDFGCGDCSWIIQAASEWQSTEFVGYDIADIIREDQQPEDFSPNIKRVFGNLLKLGDINYNGLVHTLPFEDSSFDHVRVAYLSLAVPNGNWHALMSELRRVMTQDGIIECIDEPIRHSATERDEPTTTSYITRVEDSFVDLLRARRLDPKSKYGSWQIGEMFEVIHDRTVGVVIPRRSDFPSSPSNDDDATEYRLSAEDQWAEAILLASSARFRPGPPRAKPNVLKKRRPSTEPVPHPQPSEPRKSSEYNVNSLIISSRLALPAAPKNEILVLPSSYEVDAVVSRQTHIVLSCKGALRSAVKEQISASQRNAPKMETIEEAEEEGSPLRCNSRSSASSTSELWEKFDDDIWRYESERYQRLGIKDPLGSECWSSLFDASIPDTPPSPLDDEPSSPPTGSPNRYLPFKYTEDTGSAWTVLPFSGPRSATRDPIRIINIRIGRKTSGIVDSPVDTSS